MIQISPPLSRPDIVYPESDGLPMADNSKQLEWIFVLYGNLAALYRDDAQVFVGSNQFWYPVEGMPEIRLAPDVYVIFGRPKGHRGSYQQWKEDNVPMTVVMEVLSPGNDHFEMTDKLLFYEEHGAEEYYIYDPDRNRLLVYLRRGEMLRAVRPAHAFVSPRLGIRFDLTGPEMVVYHPNGLRFRAFEELQADWEKEQKARLGAETRASEAESRASEAESRAKEAATFFRRLAELSRKARQGQASPAELAELEQLEQEGH